jgi:hypothetical protein
MGAKDPLERRMVGLEPDGAQRSEIHVYHQLPSASHEMNIITPTCLRHVIHSRLA